ncbi:hypothetical protein JW960_03265 [candidate division KSB1 bacterium]|nr:hypothetical protein [candidate division KSB1 bacterium]
MKIRSTVSYQTRNVITLLIFTLIIGSVGGYYMLFKYPKKIKFFETELKKIDQKVNALQGIETQFEMIQKQIEDEQAKLSELDKQIVTDISAAQTYTYINQLMNYSGEFKIDMIFTGSGGNGGYGYKVFNLRGEGSFHNLFRFIWYMEHGPQIYKVKSLQLRGMENRDPDTGKTDLVVPYEMQIWAMYAQINDLPAIKRQLNDVHYTSVSSCFTPYVTRDIPRNVDNLLEVERAELKAVMPDKAFVVDQAGNVSILEPGSKVYLGYVTRIDPIKNQVEFTLNKGGIVEKFVLELGFGNDESK